MEEITYVEVENEDRQTQAYQRWQVDHVPVARRKKAKWGQASGRARPVGESRVVCNKRYSECLR